MTEEAVALLALLRQSIDPSVAAAIEALVRDAPDRALCRVNVVDFAIQHELDAEQTIAAFLHAARLGIFELSWNVLCPGCAGVLNESATLKTVDQEEYSCALCAGGYQPTLDEMLKPATTRDGKPTIYGFGFFRGGPISTYRGLQEAGHGGDQQGVSSVLYLLPERQFGVVILSNLEGEQSSLDFIELSRKIYDLVFPPQANSR